MKLTMRVQYLPNVMFCHNTIVVSAMTGVAATLICGETMHVTEICPSRRVGHFKAPC